MNLQEVYQSCHGEILGKSQFVWPCWGPDCWLVVLGTAAQTWGSCVVQSQTNRVWALEIWSSERDQAWRWLDPEGQHQFFDQCSQLGINSAEAGAGVYFQDLPDPALALLILNSQLPQPEQDLDLT